MMRTQNPYRWVIAGILSLAMGVGANANAAEPKSPEQVKNALRILAYVQDDMARKLPNLSLIHI